METTQKHKEKRYYTVSEFREELGDVITRQQVYRMISKGEVPVRRLGTKIVIDGDWVRAYVNIPCVCVKKVKAV